MLKHDIFEEFQSAYKAIHSTETTLLNVSNDIMLNIDSGSGTFFSFRSYRVLLIHAPLRYTSKIP